MLIPKLLPKSENNNLWFNTLSKPAGSDNPYFDK